MRVGLFGACHSPAIGLSNCGHAVIGGTLLVQIGGTLLVISDNSL